MDFETRKVLFMLGINLVWFFGVYAYFGERMPQFSGLDRAIIVGGPIAMIWIIGFLLK